MEDIESQIANKKNVPHFDAAAIKQKKKTRAVKVAGRDGLVNSGGLGNHSREVPTRSSSPKCQRTKMDLLASDVATTSVPDALGIPEVALPLIKNSAHPFRPLG